MHIAQDPYHLPLPPRALARGCVVTIGNYDGVHYGHQELIKRTVDKARDAGLPAVVITFEPHPLQIIVGKGAPPILMSLRHKLECFASLGVDLTLVMHFNKDTASLSPDEFISEVLVKCLNSKELVVGYDSTFGKGGKGSAALLIERGQEFGFGVEQLPPVYLDSAIVSSTRVRAALLEGLVAQASRLLGRPHTAEGTVVTGMNRGGKLLGFPTANLKTSEDLLLPKPGVYAVLAEVGEKDAPQETALPPVFSTSPRSYIQGVTNIGRNPTFGDTTLSVETHLLDFHGNIYGNGFRIHFIKRLRDEIKFNGIGELMEQIRKDVEMARDVLTNGTDGVYFTLKAMTGSLGSSVIPVEHFR